MIAKKSELFPFWEGEGIFDNCNITLTCFLVYKRKCGEKNIVSPYPPVAPPLAIPPPPDPLWQCLRGLPEQIRVDRWVSGEGSVVRCRPNAKEKPTEGERGQCEIVD